MYQFDCVNLKVIFWNKVPAKVRYRYDKYKIGNKKINKFLLYKLTNVRLIN